MRGAFPARKITMDFDMLGLAPRLVNILKEQGITDPTPIQTQAIPHAMNGRDVMGLAQTGTGKTAAFGLPMIDALLKTGVKAKPQDRTRSDPCPDPRVGQADCRQPDRLYQGQPSESGACGGWRWYRVTDQASAERR